MEPSTPGTIDPPANVLLVHPSHQEPDACAELCHDDGSARLKVSFADDDPKQPYPNEDEQIGFLVVGDVFMEGADGPDFSRPIVTDSVADPTDLSEIGVAVSRFCKHWDDDGEDIAVCFDSLDALLRHTSPKKVFQFAHVLTKRLSSVDAYAHFHFDPTHHEDRIVSTFGTIFDAVVADETAEESLPEATDEEVADILSAWDDEPAIETDPGSITEATDEDIADLLGE
ncbi:hypothetical protein ACFO5R_03920 [Halosolutus amylolyticus]|uniref:Uncharacterized protein n=1 Tax=Halosolutus amylolyticus TaxID=2932267 RepID=A0ABD5PKL9_9EURY|nr:hypothetical protein [Halosolutus amylolyticus]